MGTLLIISGFHLSYKWLVQYKWNLLLTARKRRAAGGGYGQDEFSGGRDHSFDIAADSMFLCFCI